MPGFIVTGCYTLDAIKGMLAKPSDREAAARALVEAARGKLVAFHITSGSKDFLMAVEIDDIKNLVPGVMAAGASGMIANTETIHAFTSAEASAMAKKAQGLTAAYAAPGR